MSQHDYITLRIINACLRENVAELLSAGSIIEEDGKHWLYVEHLEHPIRLAVRASHYMQAWVATLPWWQVRRRDWQQESGYQRWLNHLLHGQDQQTRELYLQFAEEAAAACEQGELCQQAYRQLQQSLMRPLPQQNWGERLRHADQIASYLDHPYYPTARAKFGFDNESLLKYAPEYCQQFNLHWLAVKRQQLTLTVPDAEPDWWPTFEHVGLPVELSQSHFLLPVHPLTWKRLDAFPAGAVRAPEPFLAVYPTLSVRTVQLAAYPDRHLKLPLAIRTLGQKNIRLIKPSTLYDGQWFAELLPLLAKRDPLLNNRYRHVDERFCGHLGEEKLFAFLLRRYPRPRPLETLAPVASLASPMPDDRPYICHVLDQPGMPDIITWWAQYCQLMADVHLTLWLRFGIALESNQQNAVLSLIPGKPLSLVMKDNDAARLWPQRFISACPDLQQRLEQLLDSRIKVDDELALARMFITITLQLCLAAVLESLAEQNVLNREHSYRILREALSNTLQQLDDAGLDTALARRCLFEEPLQPVKYLLLSGSLLSKKASGAADINKFYGHSGPNFLRSMTC